MFRLARYLKNYKVQTVLGPIFKLVEAIFELIVPLVMANIIDVGVKNGDEAYIWRMGGVLILLGVVGLGCSLICQYMASNASQSVGTDLRRDLYSHINKLSHKEIDELGTSSLITRITNDINQVQIAVAMLIRLVVRAPFLVIGATVMAMMIDFKLSLIFLAAMPFIVAVLYFVMNKSIPFFKKRQTQLDKISRITQENLSGVRVIRAFSKQRYEESRFENEVAEMEKVSVITGKINAFLNPLTFVIMNLAVVLVIWFGGFQVNDGILSQGQIIAFVNYINQILLALLVVANLVVIFTKASASSSRINEVFAAKSSILEGSMKTSDCSSDILVEFKNVFFSYSENGEYALEDISFKANIGETIGIIGGTGSGKSTLINLMPRFYDLTSGEILLNGLNIKQYSFEYLRNQFGIVPQKASLFSGTIRDNMKWGNREATDEQIMKAIEIAQAKEFVEKLPDRLDTVILQGGKNLSGGQKQRLTIARAVAANPQILIFDDSASALDFATDAAFRKAIKSELSEKTIFIVSQRANSIKHADKIIVLDDGKCVGMGKHKELLNNCPLYKEICLTQFTEDELEKEANQV